MAAHKPDPEFVSQERHSPCPSAGASPTDERQREGWRGRRKMHRGLVQGQRLYNRKMDVLTPQGTKAGHRVCQSLGVLLGSTGVTSLGQRCHLQVGRASR